MRKFLHPLLLGLLWLQVSAAADVPEAAAQDAAAYQDACADCHPSAAAIARKVRGETQEEKKANLEAFLASHHSTSPAEIKQIAGYLAGLPKK